MKSLRKTMLIAAALLSAALGARLTAQQPAQSPGSAPAAQDAQTAAQQGSGQVRIRVPVNQVRIPVTVKDGSGRLVPDLRQDEFRVFEDNIEQRIAFFRADVAPISMVLLIDNDLKSKDAKQVADSLRSIVAGLSANDENFVCRFDQVFHAGKGFSNGQDKLTARVNRHRNHRQP